MSRAAVASPRRLAQRWMALVDPMKMALENAPKPPPSEAVSTALSYLSNPSLVSAASVSDGVRLLLNESAETLRLNLKLLAGEQPKKAVSRSRKGRKS